MKLFKTTFLFLVFVELLSIFAYLLPDFNRIAFFIIVFTAFTLSLYDLRIGLLMVLAELFISSKGYLFYFDLGGINVSIRIALWLVIMSVWFSKYVINLYHCYCKQSKGMRQFRYPGNSRDCRVVSLLAMTKITPYFIPLFIFITWGIINGFLRGNGFNDLFFDFNGWVYFALIFPVYSVFYSDNNKFFKDLLSVSLASIIWLSLKTMIILFIFSHEIQSIMPELYKWIRTTGVGEITRMDEGFYRVFFQSHIYVLVGFFVLLSYIVIARSETTRQSRETVKDQVIARLPHFFQSFAMARGITKDLIIFFILSVLFLTVSIINFSRSNWVGLFAGLGVLFLFISWNTFKKEGVKILFKNIFRSLSVLAAITIMSFVFILITVKFPYPKTGTTYNTGELIAKRASQVSGEAGVSSRWNLLPELWKEIKTAPFLGKGFGATVTYISNDPRVLETHIDGKYTTYAFEWGWLEIWLKFGFWGCAAYLLLIGRILYIGYAQIEGNWRELKIGLLIGLIVISVVSFFSPYLNHPLGIGYILLVAAVLDSNTWNKEL